MNECQFIFKFLVIFYYFKNEDRMKIMITYSFLLLQRNNFNRKIQYAVSRSHTPIQLGFRFLLDFKIKYMLLTYTDSHNIYFQEVYQPNRLFSFITIVYSRTYFQLPSCIKIEQLTKMLLYTQQRYLHSKNSTYTILQRFIHSTKLHYSALNLTSNSQRAARRKKTSSLTRTRIFTVARRRERMRTASERVRNETERGN